MDNNQRRTLSKHPVKELRVLCKNNKYRGYSKLRKKSLIEFIISQKSDQEGPEIKNIKEKEVVQPHECPICFEVPTRQYTVTMKCNHSLCFDCFVIHSRSFNTCPLCREQFC